MPSRSARLSVTASAGAAFLAMLRWGTLSNMQRLMLFLFTSSSPVTASLPPDPQGFVCLMQLSTRQEDVVIDAIALRSHIGTAGPLVLFVMLQRTRCGKSCSAGAHG